MKRLVLCCGAMLGTMLSGCPHDSFQIEVRPQGRKFHRKLIAWHIGDNENAKDSIQPLSAEQLARIGKVYSRHEPASGPKRTFSGEFADRPPADLGGAGRYTVLTSPLGSAYWYVERFRGNDDLHSQLMTQRQAVDQLTDLTIGWLSVELGHEPNFPRLKKFLDVEFRRDLNNLCTYQFTAQAMEDCGKENYKEMFARVGLYLCERGYFSPEDIPRLGRIDEGKSVVAHLQRLLARKLGVPDSQPMPPSLAFLGDSRKRTESFHKFVCSTELFQKRLVLWKAEKKHPAGAKEPTPDSFADELMHRVLPLPSLVADAGDEVQLRLYSGRRPFSTNGRWDEKAKAATWSATLPTHRAMPALFYACWSEPDRAYQEKHFGRVVLDDITLAHYVVGYRGLTSEEALQWDRFLDHLTPDPELESTLESFHLPNGGVKLSPMTRQVTSVIDGPRNCILEGLKAKAAAAP